MEDAQKYMSIHNTLETMEETNVLHVRHDMTAWTEFFLTEAHSTEKEREVYSRIPLSTLDEVIFEHGAWPVLFSSKCTLDERIAQIVRWMGTALDVTIENATVEIKTCVAGVYISFVARFGMTRICVVTDFIMYGAYNLSYRISLMPAVPVFDEMSEFIQRTGFNLITLPETLPQESTSVFGSSISDILCQIRRKIIGIDAATRLVMELRQHVTCRFSIDMYDQIATVHLAVGTRRHMGLVGHVWCLYVTIGIRIGKDMRPFATVENADSSTGDKAELIRIVRVAMLKAGV